MSQFKHNYLFQDRFLESHRVLDKYPDRIPIICEKSYTRNQNQLPNIDKNKYLVPFDLTLGQFIYVIRKRMNLKPEKALFLFMNGIIPPSTSMIGDLYEYYMYII